MKMRILLAAVPTFALLLTSFVSPEADAEAQIKKRTEAYIDTFNKKDATALASFWAEDGVYTNPQTGEVMKGRAAIETAFKARFQEAKDAQVTTRLGNITFPTKDEAIEYGIFNVQSPGKQPRESAFKAYFENKNGEWLLTEIRDADIAATPDQYQHLKRLDWLLGDWVDEDDDVEITSSYQWDASKNFLTNSFAVTTEGHKELEGKQIIGWDPIKKVIRSWVFDTDGTFGESIWTNKDNAWIVQTIQTLANGKKASATNTFTPIDQDSYSWSSTNREVGGNILPDISPVTVKRKKG